MSENNTNKTRKNGTPQERAALDKLKYEVASEIGIDLKKGYNGNLTSAQNGSVGGYMVKKMINAQKKKMSGSNNNQ